MDHPTSPLVRFVPAIGIDLGDRMSRFCVLDATGAIVEQGSFSMTLEGLRAAFAPRPSVRIALEVGTHTAWVHDALMHLGHEVVVFDAADFARREGGKRKSDRHDALALARAVHMDDQRIRRVQMRPPRMREALAVVRLRDVQVRIRTQAVNAVRGSMKQFGIRLPQHSPESFPSKIREHLDELSKRQRIAVTPMLDMLDAINTTIKNYDREIERLAKEEFPEAQRLEQIPGVGVLTALVVLLVIGDRTRFHRCRDVGAYLGLVPRLWDSSSINPQLGIEKAGDGLARRILVQAAHHKLSRQTCDDDLRTWGRGLCERGAKRGKKIAAVAVARKLAVTMFSMLVSGEDYDPKRMSKQRQRKNGKELVA